MDNEDTKEYLTDGAYVRMGDDRSVVIYTSDGVFTHDEVFLNLDAFDKLAAWVAKYRKELM